MYIIAYLLQKPQTCVCFEDPHQAARSLTEERFGEAEIQFGIDEVPSVCAQVM